MKRIFGFFVAGLLLPSIAMAVEIYKKDDMSLNVGWWGQVWFQNISDMNMDNDDEKYDDNLNDFLIRRSYFYLDGTITPELSFFVHFASDKLGMDEITNDSDKGLGSGIAVRDAWLTYKILGDDLMVQVGRMYIPFTRNYGTTSTKAMLTLDLDWGQGGSHSGIFYPSNIGRDDSITLWGNVLEDKLQYRLMIGDGEDNNTKNPDDNVRFAGRLSYSFFDPETKWFNSETYLGTKRILAIGAGFDFEHDMVIAGKKDDYTAWTVDFTYDQPMAQGNSLTLVLSYINISHVPNAITWTQLGAGDDGDITSAKIGYYFGDKLALGNLQPYTQVQNIHSDESGDDDTMIYGFGLNYYLKGVANKISLEASFMDQDEEVPDSAIRDNTTITLQFALGF